MIRKEAWPLYRASSGVRLCWKLEEPKGPKGRKQKIRGGNKNQRRSLVSISVSGGDEAAESVYELVVNPKFPKKYESKNKISLGFELWSKMSDPGA